jgi:plastocyanin
MTVQERCAKVLDVVLRPSRRGGILKKMSAVGSLVAALFVLVFAAIAAAQISPDQSSLDPNGNSRVGQAQSPTAGQQETTTGQQETTTSGQATPPQSTPTVRILADRFDPLQLNVPSGTPVNFINDDRMPHTVVLEGLLDTQEISPGYAYPVTLEGTGTVKYHDEKNPQMQGTLTLGGANGGGTAAPTTNNPQGTTTPQETTTPQQPTQQNGGETTAPTTNNPRETTTPQETTAPQQPTQQQSGMVGH